MSTTITDVTDLHPAWGARFNAGDVDGMLALAETGSAFAPAPGALVTGEDYRAALAGFLSLGLPIDLTLRRSLVVDDLALLVYDWTIQGTAADGQTISRAGTTADVAREAPTAGDSSWTTRSAPPDKPTRAGATTRQSALHGPRPPRTAG